jgi:hypothetical protein
MPRLAGKRLTEPHLRFSIPPRQNGNKGTWENMLQALIKELYRVRHLVENAFLHLKRGRGICTHHAKTTASFVAAVQIRCIALWLAVLASLLSTLSKRLWNKTIDTDNDFPCYAFVYKHKETLTASPVHQHRQSMRQT